VKATVAFFSVAWVETLMVEHNQVDVRMTGDCYVVASGYPPSFSLGSVG
jgi:hypothetical protein